VKLNETLHLWWFPERECLVQLPDDLLNTMKTLAYEAMPNETGGTLVGYYSEDRRVAFVTQVLVAKTGARRERSGFFRPPDSVDDQLKKVLKESKSRTYFLGDWHSHPIGKPSPSSVDLGTLRGLARSPSVATDTPIMIIVGGDFDSRPLMSCTLAEKSGRCLNGKYEERTRKSTSGDRKDQWSSGV
jgi:integrative and conjugative element protein (TIGR02256 family)